METLCIVSQKGGSGKTTIAVHMAVCAAISGLHVACIDLDPQGSLFDWNEEREPSRKLDATKATATELPVLLTQCKRTGIDLVIIDTAPHMTREATAAAQFADFCLIPCRPARFDLRAMGSTLLAVRATNTPHAVLINAAPPKGFRLADQARAGLESVGATVFSQIVHQYAVFSHAVIGGESVHEYAPGSEAADEIERVFANVAGILRLYKQTRKRVIA